MYSFDLHVHPSIKASLTRPKDKKTAWEYIKLKLKPFRFNESLESQSNLTQLKKGLVNLAVNPLSGLEMAFAKTAVLRIILASEIVSDLDRSLFTGIMKGNITYYEMFNKDLKEIENSKVRIASHFGEINEDELNIILAVEGAHSFMEKTSDTIIPNFKACKAKYRFLYLTLTHLNREPACVHCFGTKIQILELDINITPSILFRPDSRKCGISPLGKDIIREAYDDSTYILPIDIKHMSYVSRMEFYKLREEEGWEKIPVVASHCGVAGGRMSEARVICIEDDRDSGCKLVRWGDTKTVNNTKFNPWTISLYDEDIEKVIESRGLIGISFDQRVLGYGKIYGEYLSPPELDFIIKTQNITIPDLFPAVEMTEPPVDGRLDPDIKTIMEYEAGLQNGILNEEHYADILFESGLEYEGVSPVIEGESHMDYFSCNVLHILKVGFKKGFDGKDGRPDVRRCVCIGSDLDGLVDSINFPAKEGELSIDKNNYVTADKYARVRKEFIISFDRCIKKDEYFSKNPVDLSGFTEMLFYTNGYEFLKENFKKRKDPDK